MTSARKRRVWPLRNRWLTLLVTGPLAAFFVVLGASWLDVSRAKGELNVARTTLVALANDSSSLRSDTGRAKALAQMRAASNRIAGARRHLERSAALRAAGALPGFSTQREGAIALVRDAQTGAGAVLRLVTALDELAANEQTRGGTVPLDGLRRMRVHLRRTGEAVDRTRASPLGLWGPLGTARRDLNRMAAETSSRLQEAARSMASAETFLGADGPRRYLVAAENNAEMRDRGMVLSYAFVKVEAGTFRIEHSGPIADLALRRPVGLPIPHGMAQMFGGLEPTLEWRSVNATADFAWSGRVMAEMAEQATGQAVDGVIAIDVFALAAALRVVGPVAVASLPTPVTADNAADLLLNKLYEGLPHGSDQTERRERLVDVFGAVIDSMVGGSYDAVQLGSELGEAASTGHLRLWSANASEEAAFERSGIGGGPGLHRPDRTLHISVQNATATKLDYFVTPAVKIRVALTPQGDAVIETEVVVKNNTPTEAPDSYQFGPDRITQSRPGQYVTRVYFWGPRGSEQADSVEESGLRLNQGPTSVDPGKQASVRFHTVIPNAVREGRLDLRLVPQPRASPMELRVTLSAPGWDVDGPDSIEPVWDRPLTLSWQADR